MFICMQKINFITQFFVSIAKKIANLLFWVNWTCLTTLTQNDNSNLKEPVTFICTQKIKSILQVFLEILQGYCELVFSTLGMPGYANPK